MEGLEDHTLWGLVSLRLAELHSLGQSKKENNMGNLAMLILRVVLGLLLVSYGSRSVSHNGRTGVMYPCASANSTPIDAHARW